MMLDALQIFFGDANAAETRVYARLPVDAFVELTEKTVPAEIRSYVLRGTVMGPYCAYAKTLTATIPLSPVKLSPVSLSAAPAAEALLAEAIVPDPCFWTTELPFLYKLSLALMDGQTVISQTDRTFGIRPLGARGKRFVYEGQPWVLRAASTDADTGDLATWHEAALAMYVSQPAASFCQQASEQGVLLAVDLSELPAESLIRWLQQNAHWPAVALIMLPRGYPWQDAFRQHARNAIWVERFRGDATPSPARWADAICLESADAQEIARQAHACQLPVLARCPVDAYLGPEELRRHCDQLQQKLAGTGEYAGYLV